MLALWWGVDFAAWGEVDPVFWMPIGAFEFLGIRRLDPAALGVLSAVWKASLGLCCVGLFTRPAAWVAAGLGFYLVGIPHSLGDLSHGDAAAVLLLIVMAFARSGDAWSVDAALRRRRGGASSAPSGEYRWPVRLAWVVLAHVFFAAGWAKAMNGGLPWVFSPNMAYILAEHQFPPEHPEAVLTWGRWMSQHAWIYVPMAGGAFALELLYPLALLHPVLRVLLVPPMVVAVIGFRLLLGPSFYPLILCHLFWVPWDRILPERWTRPGRGGERPRTTTAAATTTATPPPAPA